MSKLLRPLCGALTLVTLATTTEAQVSIAVEADVSTQLALSGARLLDFGTVYPGFSKVIAATAATAGKFTLNGGPGANVTVTFTLPTNLTLVAGTAQLPIATWTGCRNTTDATTGCTAFTPSNTAFTAQLGSGGLLVLFVGATVTAASSQAAGAYAGTISMTAAYTGT